MAPPAELGTAAIESVAPSTFPPSVSNGTVGIAKLQDDLASFFQLDLKNRFLANPGLTTVGASALWAAFLSFLITSIYLVVLSLRRKRTESKRLMQFALFFSNAIPMVAYLCMALSLGRVYSPRVVLTDNSEGANSTQRSRVVELSASIVWEAKDPPFFYARYICEALSLPSRVWLLGHMVSVDTSTSVLAMTVSFGMVLCWLFGGLFPSEFASKWLLWLCGFWFYILLMFILLKPFRAASAKRFPSGKRKKGISASRRFMVLNWWLVLVISIYPWMWFLAEGTHWLQADAEVIIYSLLDLLSIAGFSYIAIHFKTYAKRTTTKGRPKAATELPLASLPTTPRLGTALTPSDSIGSLTRLAREQHRMPAAAAV